MLLKEYEERMGNRVDPEVFDNKIHPLYMMTNLDKDAFCDDYKLHGHSKILEEVAAYAIACERGQKAQMELHDKYVEKTHSQMLKVAAHLIYIDEDLVGEQSYDLAVELAGQSFVTSFKLKSNLELNQKDKDYLLGLMK